MNVLQQLKACSLSLTPCLFLYTEHDCIAVIKSVPCYTPLLILQSQLNPLC